MEIIGIGIAIFGCLILLAGLIILIGVGLGEIIHRFIKKLQT